MGEKGAAARISFVVNPNKIRYSEFVNPSTLEFLKKQNPAPDPDSTFISDKASEQDEDFYELEEEFFMRKIVVCKDISMEKNQFDWLYKTTIKRRIDREILYLACDSTDDEDSEEEYI